jgi:hypothetical protein
VSQPLAEPPHLPPATEQQVRSHAARLVELAARYGITDLAFASPGRLRGHVANDRDLFDMFEFQRAASDVLGAEVTLYSDGALHNEHVSPDLAAATPL